MHQQYNLSHSTHGLRSHHKLSENLTESESENFFLQILKLYICAKKIKLDLSPGNVTHSKKLLFSLKIDKFGNSDIDLCVY